MRQMLHRGEARLTFCLNVVCEYFALQNFNVLQKFILLFDFSLKKKS